MTAKDLKNSILQLAIQGKLVEQREEEGTAKELLEKIEAEKKKLINEGKIKKTMALPEINEDEIPFDIPESWEWVKLGEIIDVRDGTHDTPKYVTNGVPLVTSKNLKQGKIDFDNVKFISLEDSEKINTRSGVDDGDILFAMIGSIGNPVLVNKTRDFSIKNMALFKPIKFKLFNMEYLLNYLQLEQESMKRKAAGGVQSFISLTFLRKYLVPLPPLAEQKRIVAKIEELMPYVYKYDAAYSEVEELNKKFPEDMQKSVLLYAVQGKLVEQREEDGTAEELYKQIQEEKKKLINEGKIKKTMALPEITEDEIPFDIPVNWRWVRLGEVAVKITDGSHNPPPKKTSGYYVISAKNVKNGKIVFDNVDRYTDEEGFLKENSRTKIKCGDIIMGIIGGSIGNIAIYDHDEKVIAQRSIAIIDTLANNEFVKIILQSAFIQHQLKNTSSTAQSGVYLGTINELVIPLPPLAEQKRIVKKIEELLPYTKQLVK
jgi:type I restriction enzyme S subunit